MPPISRVRLILAALGLAILGGCGGKEGTVTPVAADQKPTSESPVGKEPTLAPDDEGSAPADQPGRGGEPGVDER